MLEGEEGREAQRQQDAREHGLRERGGIAATRRASGRRSPHAMISTPVTRKAPTAAGQPPSTYPWVARRAAPGVDHAIVSGMRYRHER
ncbi:hypothetical protein GCM10025876_12730 [Demequina litorisediminis]|uniref:Uncharacterized protein n=1 Tax=Demequina litorisediminis TaxID=1849022 RepID=A0ABQ6IED3_9MICO|nr:hypothetical protein GCM10025876_12730 [Demequina litorisediminis]